MTRFADLKRPATTPLNGKHAPEAQTGRSPGNESRSSELPEIVVSNRQLRDIGDDAYRALVAANNPPVVFVRAGELVRIVEDEEGRPIIEAVNEYALQGRLTQAADFFRWTAKGERTSVSPSLEIVKHLLSRGYWPGISPIAAVTEIPVLRPDGTILDVPGYDRITRLFYTPSVDLDVPPIDEAPAAERAARAARYLLRALNGFPFVDESDRANALAGIITPVCRPMIAGNIPLGITTATQAGTGKTLLSSIAGIIQTGRVPDVTTAPASDEEFDKRILAALARGSSYMTFDNVEGLIQAPSLARLLTAPIYTGRVLGQTKMIDLPNRAVWVANGNNVRLGGDLPRRSCWVRLDAKMSRPWERDDFDIQDLEGYVFKHRGRMIAAVLTMARAWVVAGRPPPDNVPVMGSFQGWVDTVGGILAFAGVERFLDNAVEMYEAGDLEGTQWLAFLNAWYDQFGNLPILSKAVDEACRGYHDEDGNVQHSAIYHALPDDLADAYEKPGASFARVLGRALSSREGRRYGDEQVRVEKLTPDRHSKILRWRVVKGDAS